MDHPKPTARLLISALRAFEADLQERLHADGYHDVSVAQTNVLRHLDLEGMRMNDFARDAGITKQAISQAVKALVARDLVRVEPDPDDGRARRVMYTERGLAMIHRAREHVLLLETAWAERLGHDRYVQLRQMLSELV